MNDAGWLVENYVSFRLFRVPNVTVNRAAANQP